MYYLAHISWVGSVLHRFCTPCNNGIPGMEDLDYLDRDLSKKCVVRREVCCSLVCF